MFFPVLVPDLHPLALDNDAWGLRFKGFVLDHMMPDIGAVCLDNGGQVIGAEIVHGCSPKCEV